MSKPGGTAAPHVPPLPQLMWGSSNGGYNAMYMHAGTPVAAMHSHQGAFAAPGTLSPFVDAAGSFTPSAARAFAPSVDYSGAGTPRPAYYAYTMSPNVAYGAGQWVWAGNGSSAAGPFVSGGGGGWHPSFVAPHPPSAFPSAGVLVPQSPSGGWPAPPSSSTPLVYPQYAHPSVGRASWQAVLAAEAPHADAHQPNDTRPAGDAAATSGPPALPRPGTTPPSKTPKARSRATDAAQKQVRVVSGVRSPGEQRAVPLFSP